MWAMLFLPCVVSPLAGYRRSDASQSLYIYLPRNADARQGGWWVGSAVSYGAVGLFLGEASALSRKRQRQERGKAEEAAS